MPTRDSGAPALSPFERALAEAPYDDEPETPEERAAVGESDREIAEGQTVSTAEVRRKLDL